MTAIAEGFTLEETALAELTAGLRGHVVGRDHPNYDEQRRIWNGSIDRKPALIARCTGVADVVAAVGFAQQHGLPLTVRGGGHSFPGLAVADGALVVDLGLMRGVRSTGGADRRALGGRTPRRARPGDAGVRPRGSVRDRHAHRSSRV